MRATNVLLGTIGFSILAFGAATGCSSDDSGGTTPGTAGTTATAGTAGSAGTATGTAGSAGSAGTAGTGGTAGTTSTAGTAGTTGGTDTGGTDSGGAGGDSAGAGGDSAGAGGEGGGDCPTPAPTAAAGQQWVIVSVDFGANSFVVKNVSGGELDASTLFACNFDTGGTRYNAVVGGAAVADGAEIELTATDVMLPATGGELGIYDGITDNSQYGQGGFIRAYVAWGASAGTRAPVAAGDGFWTADDVVAVSGDGGLVATGAANEAAGWTAVPANCFE